MINKTSNFCNSRLEMIGGLHSTAALLIIIYNSIFYSFFIRDFYSYIALMYCMGSSMCIALLTMEAWPENTKKYHGVFWIISLLFALPLPYFFEFYTYTITPEFILRLSLSLFMLGMLVDWLVFLIMSIFSWLAASVTTSYLGVKMNFVNNPEILEITILLSVMIMITTFLMKKRQESISRRLRVAQSVPGILSHEIRTPLATIHMQIQLLQESIHLKDSQEDIQRIFTKIAQSEAQISNFIDHSLIKIQSEHSIHLEKIRVNDEIKEILDTYQLGATPYFDISLNLCRNDFEFCGDKALFRHVILNLLKNSIYHVSRSTNPKISISSEELYDMNILVLKDNGEGIDDNVMDQLFDSFVTTKSTGTGLGLFFCKQVMHKFGGKIVCESKKHSFTKFKLFFPKIEE